MVQLSVFVGVFGDGSVWCACGCVGVGRAACAPPSIRKPERGHAAGALSSKKKNKQERVAATVQQRFVDLNDRTKQRLMFIRHGESEANVANDRLEAEQNKAVTEAKSKKLDQLLEERGVASEAALTDEDKAAIEAAGKAAAKAKGDEMLYTTYSLHFGSLPEGV